MAVGVGAVELPQVSVRGVIVDGPPAGWRNAFESAVDEHSLGVGVVESVIVGQAREHWGGADRRQGRRRRRGRVRGQRAVDGGKDAIDEDIAVVGFGVANPHEGPYRLDLAAAEKGGANAGDGVAVADERTVSER